MSVPGSGLDPVVVDQWRRMNGREGELGPHRSRLLRSRGRSGIDQYAAFVDLESPEPDDFEQLLYWRPLSRIFTYCLLQNAVRLRRTEDLIIEYPSNFLVLTVQTMGYTTGTANGREFTSRPGQLTITDFRYPYDVTTPGTSDETGVWIPTESLGGDIAAGATVPPVVPDTVLSRACASLVVRLARDVAIGGVDADLETELAVIDAVRAMLEQEKSTTDVRENPLFVREAVVDLIERNFRDPAFGAASVARHLHISRRQLYRGLEGEDRSLAEMIGDRRLEWARTLLAQPERVRLEGIALSAGFSSTATLRNRFRAKYGMTPDEYRRSMTLSATGEE
ncbi:helix-turn-helix domain-containing protein [Gordonia sp. CPCC 205515]|uniref:helix-turn-helix domain-containing protein n=1 Tax=Gordonia sp. CPCC 205515 TaxID=3140791 RepID=UPI003AF3B1E3